MKYCHFILTRFNLHLYTIKYKDKNNQEINPESWLLNRFQLFETYCLPSIANQTNKNFKWIVLYDKKTPKKWFDKIESYKDICSNYEFKFYNGSLSCLTEDCINKKYTHIVTTRLDNDDCLAAATIEYIQKNIFDQELLFLNILNGYRYDNINKDFYELQRLSNPFITAVELLPNAKTILGWGNHRKIIDEYENYIKNLTLYRGWMQIIHDSNLYLNETIGKNIGKQIPPEFSFTN